MKKNAWQCCCLLPLCLLAALGVASATEPQERTYRLTLAGVRELARASAPAALAARARVDVARGELTGASLWPFNPEIEAGAGPRWSGDDTSVDLDATLSQRFEPGGRRSARVGRAAALVEQATADTEDALRELLRDVSIVFVRALHAEQALRVARDHERLAENLRGVAVRRQEVGDIGVLDVNVATLVHARAQAATLGAEARHVRLLGRLRALLGLPPEAEIILAEDLADRRRYELPALLARAPDRADLRALVAEAEAAQAEQRMGESLAWPDVALFTRYGREEGADIVVGGLSFALPVFDRGQGIRETADARRRAAEFELEAARIAVLARVRSAYAAYELLDRAARHFGEESLPRLGETLDLARRSYEVGATPMGEMLALQRELVEARLAHVDLLLEAALAGIELEAQAGLLP